VVRRFCYAGGVDSRNEIVGTGTGGAEGGLGCGEEVLVLEIGGLPGRDRWDLSACFGNRVGGGFAVEEAGDGDLDIPFAAL
jgi:hypothetical protein